MAQLRAITYSRVSTGRQAESGISLDEQDRSTLEAIQRRGWQVTRRFSDAGRSGKSIAGRPELREALAMLAKGEADALVVAKLDRLARSTVDLASLMAQAKKESWALVVLDLDVDTSTPAGELLAGIVGTVAQYERRLIGERARMTHAHRRARGLRAGEKPILSEELRARITERVEAGESLSEVARCLNNAGTPTAKGGKWYPSTVAHVVRSVQLDRELAGARP